MLAQVKRIKNMRKEFIGLRDVDIENALKDCPAESRDAAINDFERDMVAALTVPDMPVKKLRAYLYVAAKETARAGGIGDEDGGAMPTDTQELEERACQAIADAQLRAERAAATKAPCVAGAAMPGKEEEKHGRK
jgi:hypothetical protein